MHKFYKNWLKLCKNATFSNTPLVGDFCWTKKVYLSLLKGLDTHGAKRQRMVSDMILNDEIENFILARKPPCVSLS